MNLAGLAHEVALHDSDEVFEALSTVMPGWGVMHGTSDADPERAVTTIRRDRDGTFRFQSRWAESPLTGLGLAGATCGAVADLIQAYLDERPGTLGLHCGAVRIAGQLGAFTGAYRAGKSTLVTRLGAEPGCALFCDDILPVDPDGTALALGVQPRLRLPLPDAVAPAFRDHVARRLTVHDHRYGFISDPQQACLGTRDRLAAMIVLCRQDGARARFHDLGQSEAAALLIQQNIADPINPDAHYDRIETLAKTLVGLTLVYSDLEEAIALVRDTFVGMDGPRLREPLGPALTVTGPDDAAEPADMMQDFARADEVVMRQIGKDIFLWQMETRNFFSLNAVGGIVWTLLETRQSGKSIVASLHEIFPGTPVSEIERDVAILLGQMQRRRLVTP